MQHHGKMPKLRKAYSGQQSRDTYALGLKHVTHFSKNGTKRDNCCKGRD